MRVSVSLLPSIRPIDPSTQVAIVIDVLRATSVMTVAMANGAKEIVTFKDIDDATHFANTSGHRSDVLLCGERHCKRVEGFDLGNSPAEYDRSVVKGKTIALTTTNGTRAIAAAERVETVLIGSFLNLSSIVIALSEYESAHLVCAGTNGEITAEDVSLAGAIIAGLSKHSEIEFQGDDAILASALWESWFPGGVAADADLLASRFRHTFGGRSLVDVGYQKDLLRCANISSLDAIPKLTSRNPCRFHV